jgi:hypothetical protein
MRVTLRLPDELHQRLQERSHRAGASLNQTVVAVISDALAREGAAEHLGERDEQVRYIRVALGDLTVEWDDSGLPSELRPSARPLDRDAFLRSLPRLTPPLSATIVEERDDRF